MSAPTPEDVAREIIARVTVGGFPLSDLDGAGVLTKQIAAALRAARAAAIEEAINIELPCDVRLPPGTVIRKGCKLSTLAVALECRGMTAIRALGEESARGEPHGGCPK